MRDNIYTRIVDNINAFIKATEGLRPNTIVLGVDTYQELINFLGGEIEGTLLGCTIERDERVSRDYISADFNIFSASEKVIPKCDKKSEKNIDNFIEDLFDGLEIEDWDEDLLNKEIAFRQWLKENNRL